MAVRHFLENHWPSITIAMTATAIAGAFLVMLRSMPPHQIVMATGREGDVYYEMGERYRAALLYENVQVQLVPTAGSVENLAMLRDPHSGVSVALIEGGILSAADTSGVESLGKVVYEPLWWFHKREILGEAANRLRGQRISIGPEGSGTRALTLELLKRTGMEPQVGELLALEPREAGEKLLAGQIDMAFMMTSWESPVVQQLLADDRVTLSSFQHADAFIALYPFLTKVVVPRGVTDIAKTDIAKDRPSTDVVLVATEAIDIPLSDEALRFYKSGLPFLHDYFPFWMAALIGKLIILLIPILGVLYPMVRFLPRVYDWRMRSKVLRMYGELRFLEDELRSARGTGRDTKEMVARLDRLEEQANHLRIPVAYASMMYELRNHIDLVSEDLKKHTKFKEAH